MRKKVKIAVSILLVMTVLVSAVTFSKALSENQKYYCNENYIYEILPNGCITIHCYIGTATDVIVPSVIDGRDVESVESLAFYATNVKKLTISEGITTLCDEAFFYSTSLEEVTLPATIKKVGQGVFRDCANLKKVTFDEKNGALGKYMFYGCTNLEDVNIPTSVSHIPVGAFSYCMNLKNITLPQTLSVVYDYGFYASGLLSIALPNGLCYIYDRAFAECTSLAEIKGGGGVFYFVADNAFKNCIARIPDFIIVGTEDLKPTTTSTDLTETTTEPHTISPTTSPTCSTDPTESSFEPRPPVEPTATFIPCSSEANTESPSQWVDVSTDPSEDTTAVPTTSPQELITPDGYFIGGTSGFLSHESSQIASAKNTADTKREELLSLAFNVRNLGDANNDGRVNIKDASQIQKFVALLISENPKDFIYKNADVDTDGKITVRDATKIQKFTARLINSLY